MKRSPMLVALLVVSAGAVADPDEVVVREMAARTNLTVAEIRAHYNACDSGVTLPMKICASYRFHVADARLNRLYEQALVSARAAGSDGSLIESQRAWFTYREATCAYEGKLNAGGGSAEGLYVLACDEQLTKARADWVEEQLKVTSQ